MLEKKRCPPAQAAGALALAVLIALLLWYWLHEASRMLESHIETKSPALFVLCLISYPLSGAVALGLLLPILVYILDYAPWQKLVLPRPDHYVRLVLRVWPAWFANHGKLTDKDL